MEFYIILCIGAFVGGFINGLAGFGTALFTLGFFLHIMSPVAAVAIILVMSFTSGLLGLWAVRADLLQNMKAASFLIIPGLIGVPFGVYSLAYIDVDLLKLLVASLLLIYGGYFTLRSKLPLLAGARPLTDMSVGFIGGVLGGLASLSGALPTMWFAMRDRSKQVMRTIIQSYNMALFVLAIGLFWFNGAYKGEVIWHATIAILVALVSAQLGIMLFKRLSDHQFRRLLIVLTFISGVILMSRIILAQL